VLLGLCSWLLHDLWPILTLKHRHTQLTGLAPVGEHWSKVEPRLRAEGFTLGPSPTGAHVQLVLLASGNSVLVSATCRSIGAIWGEQAELNFVGNYLPPGLAEVRLDDSDRVLSVF
jgi:hypothetical protein